MTAESLALALGACQPHRRIETSCGPDLPRMGLSPVPVRGLRHQYRHSMLPDCCVSSFAVNRVGTEDRVPVLKLHTGLIELNVVSVLLSSVSSSTTLAHALPLAAHHGQL